MAKEGGKRPREAASSRNPASRKDIRKSEVTEEIREEPVVKEEASSSACPAMEVDEAQEVVDRA
eukprot:11900764-Karenia_brevis.AAC.1